MRPASPPPALMAFILLHAWIIVAIGISPLLVNLALPHGALLWRARKRMA